MFAETNYASRFTGYHVEDDSDSDDCQTTIIKTAERDEEIEDCIRAIDEEEAKETVAELSEVINPWAKIDKNISDKPHDSAFSTRKCDYSEHPIVAAAKETWDQCHEFHLSADDLWHVYHSVLFYAIRIPPLESHVPDRFTRVNRFLCVTGDAAAYAELLAMIHTHENEFGILQITKCYCKLVLIPILEEIIAMINADNLGHTYNKKDFAQAALFYDAHPMHNCLSGWLFDLAPKAQFTTSLTVTNTKFVLHVGRIDALVEQRPLFYSPTFARCTWSTVPMEKRRIYKHSGRVTIVN